MPIGAEADSAHVRVGGCLQRNDGAIPPRRMSSRTREYGEGGHQHSRGIGRRYDGTRYTALLVAATTIRCHSDSCQHHRTESIEIVDFETTTHDDRGRSETSWRYGLEQHQPQQQ